MRPMLRPFSSCRSISLSKSLKAWFFLATLYAVRKILLVISLSLLYAYSYIPSQMLSLLYFAIRSSAFAIKPFQLLSEMQNFYVHIFSFVVIPLFRFVYSKRTYSHFHPFFRQRHSLRCRFRSQRSNCLT